jgi:hypothetical protein
VSSPAPTYRSPWRLLITWLTADSVNAVEMASPARGAGRVSRRDDQPDAAARPSHPNTNTRGRVAKRTTELRQADSPRVRKESPATLRSRSLIAYEAVQMLAGTCPWPARW